MHNHTPEQPVPEAPASRFIDEKLFKSRSITIFGDIDEKIARSVTEKLLALAAAGDAETGRQRRCHGSVKTRVSSYPY